MTEKGEGKKKSRAVRYAIVVLILPFFFNSVRFFFFILKLKDFTFEYSFPGMYLAA